MNVVRPAVHAVSLAILLTGCAGPLARPRVGVGDPAVFTMLHMAAAEASATQSEVGTMPIGTVRDDMLRYFRTSDTEYQRTKIRADDMLDSLQGAQSTAQLASSALTLSAKVTWLKLGMPELPVKSPTTKPATSDNAKGADTAKAAEAGKADADKTADAGKGTDAAKTADGKAEDSASKAGDSGKPAPAAGGTTAALPTLTDAEKADLAKALSDVVSDSAFDRIDRAYDFYNSLHLKLLMMYGRDSRAFDSESLWRVVQNQQLLRLLNQIDLANGAAVDAAAHLASIAAQKPALEADLKVLQDKLTAQRAALTTATSSPGFQGIGHDLLGTQMSIKVTGADPMTPRQTTPPAIDAPTPPVPATPVVTDADIADATAKVAALTAQTTEQSAQLKRLQDRADALKAERDKNTAPAAWPDSVSRLVFLTFPISVTPGTTANQMCGVRIHLIDNADKVHIISLTPQRTYDLQSQVNIDLAEKIFDLSLSADLGTDSPARPSGQAEFDKKNQQRTEVRRNFLSRMSKQGAFVDAPNSEFGWNFFPTNLQVNEVSAGKRFLDQLFGTPKDYTINAYVDGGVYNCGAYLLVPHDLTSFSYSVDYVYAEIDQDGNGGDECRYVQGDHGKVTRAGDCLIQDHKTRTVELPTASSRELEAAFVQQHAD